MRYKLILVLILFLGIIFRIADINNNPSSLYGDELTIVYDALSLLKVGQDQLGNPHPLTFEMGAGRPAGYVYFSVPFVALFGPTALGVRMLSILSGLGIILLLYLMGKKLFGEKVGLAASAITAFSPWDISLSRGGFEAHFALFLSLLGIYFLMLAKGKTVFYIFSSLFFGLVIHTYPTYKLSLPLIIPFVLWYQGAFKNIRVFKDKIYVTVSALIISMFGLLALSQISFGSSELRFSEINIFAQEKPAQQIEQKLNLERTITGLPLTVARYFHNRPLEYAKVFIENYLQNFSLDFLVIHGDGHPRHNMATMGGIYLGQFILFLIGLVSFWTKYKKILTVLLFWFVLAPIPTAIVDVPHALRSSFMLPPIIMISALGAITLINKKSKIFLTGIGILFLIQFVFFAQKLYFLAPNEYSNFWSYPAKLASQIALDNKDNFKYIILSDRIDNIEFAYPVYAMIDPSLVISQNKTNTHLGSYQFKNYGNVYIGYIPDGEVEDFISSLDSPVIFVGSSEQGKFLHNFETIEGLDKSTALVLKRKE